MSAWVLIVTAAVAGLLTGLFIGWAVLAFRAYEKGHWDGMRSGFNAGMSACNVGAPKSIELRNLYGMNR